MEILEEKEEEKVHSLEQYGRKQHFEFAGIPVKENENRNNMVIQIAKLVNKKITSYRISALSVLIVTQALVKLLLSHHKCSTCNVPSQINPKSVFYVFFTPTRRFFITNA